MTAVFERVREIVSETSSVPLSKLYSYSAIDQDVRISGDDVTELAEGLANEFGDWVWAWPWQRFACLDEGLSPLFPFMLAWQLMSWPFRGSFSYPSPYERLELRHIAKVIEQDHWADP